ncbi:hypothetical protein [Flavobacterium subsaxonicum]|uniref:Uncharacterized protein n=1 Tax=Flavobacterium subsaxonicum WB 4.1-42 = DSM 21790 TaxID=1121898 RepID=A0A0A2MKB5_9FLAO|nr:hypothetical protein [Flavobacterium subsaxonicum]KGO91938.1 hypothetical protein Q766_14945 [Flavobacterium subsaxonicum WB 4.1-42 = DSM 21790]
MKLFSLILSVIVFFVSLYFFVLEIPYVDGLNDIIYASLLVILMTICIVGVIINWEFFRLYKQKKNKVLYFATNGFSKKVKS